MSKITLLHNDPDVLDPTDKSLCMRGSVEIDGKDQGSWEEHKDGTWTARFEAGPLTARSKAELIALIVDRLERDAQ
jgi:hypothetical protein